MGSVLCEHCNGQCCRYLALPIDKPKTRRDFDDIRWYLLHRNVLVFVEDGDWYIQFTTPCRHLGADHRCGIYDRRPAICREYATAECDYRAGEYEYDLLFTEPEQIEAFARRFIRERRLRARRRTSGRRQSPTRASRGPASPQPQRIRQGRRAARNSVVSLRMPPGLAV